jgi:hypothetical protein
MTDNKINDGEDIKEYDRSVNGLLPAIIDYNPINKK